MKKLTMLLVGFLPLILFASPVPILSAASGGGPDGQSDHMLIDGSGTPPAEHGYCGVGTPTGEPWELHVAYSGGGTLTVTFRDGSAVAFPVPAGNSFSLTQAMGGVPGVDDLVRIDITSGGAWVSARARSGAKDPFTEPVAESDNFCINIPAEQLAGTVTVTLPGTLPSAFDGGDGLLD